MAQQVITDTQLRLVFALGVDDKGKPVYKNKNFNNIKPSAPAEALYSVATAIEGLQSKQLADIQRNDSSMLTN